MSRHRRLPGLGHLCGRAFVKGVAITVAGLLLVVGGTGVAQVQQSGEPQRTPLVTEPDRATPVERLMRRFACSSLGFGDDATPRSALVREPGGRLRMVSFDEGWAVYTARGDRELVAVCLRSVVD